AADERRRLENHPPMGERVVAKLVTLANEPGRKVGVRRQFGAGEEESGLDAFALQDREDAVSALGCRPVVEREGYDPRGCIDTIDKVSEELKVPQAAEVQSPVCADQQSGYADYEDSRL